MKRHKRFLCFAGLLLLVLSAVVTGLGASLASRELNQVISYHADGSSLYAAVSLGDSHSYLICQNDFRTGKRYGMKFPSIDAEGNRYSLRYLGKEAPGQTAVLLDVYKEDLLLRSEVWVCCPREQSARKIYTCEYADEPEYSQAFMVTDTDGILILKFVPISIEDGDELIYRTLYYSDQYETPVDLTPLRIIQLTTTTFYASAGQGVWYTDRYGNVSHCRENGTVVYILKNDGTRVSVNNVGYSPTRTGFYFYNLDDEKDYWIGDDGILTEFDAPALDEFRSQGFEVREVGIDAAGILYADLRRGDEPVRLAVMVPGEEPAVLSGIRIPAGLWLPYALVLSLLLTVFVLVVFLGIRRLFRRIRVIPVSVRIFAAAAVVLFLGGAGIYGRIYGIFYEERLEKAKSTLCNAAWLEAGKLDQSMLILPDVNYFEDRIYEKALDQWTVTELSGGETASYRRDFEFGYFRIADGMAYPILGTEFVTTPAEYTLTGGELALLYKAMEEQAVVCGTYTENGFEYLAAYSPVVSDEGQLSGLVRCSLLLETRKALAMGEAAPLSGRILLGFFLILLAVLLLIHGALKPLRQLSVFIRNLEERKSGSAMAAKGQNEVSELVGIVNRMSENIREYMEDVHGLKERYEAFVPEDLVTLFGTEDIRTLMPGDTAVCEAVLAVINMADFNGLQARTGADEMFRQINAGLAVMIPEVKADGGRIVRFFEGGMIVLFPEPGDRAIPCVERIMERLSAVCPARYFAAMDFRTVRLEIIGSESRMDFTVRSEDWTTALGLWRLAEKRELGTLATEAIVERQRQEAAIRSVGVVFHRFEGRLIPVYELFGAQDEGERLLKQVTLPLFETGLRLFYTGQLSESRNVFAGLLRKNSRDTAARRYFDLCDRLLSGSLEMDSLYFDEI